MNNYARGLYTLFSPLFRKSLPFFNSEIPQNILSHSSVRTPECVALDHFLFTFFTPYLHSPYQSLYFSKILEITDAYFEYTKDQGSKIIYHNRTCYVCDSNNIWQEDNGAYIRSILIEPDFNEYLLINKSNKINFQTAREWDNLVNYFKKDIRFHKPKTFSFNNKPDILAFSNKKCVVMSKFNKQQPYFIRDLQPNDFTTISTGFPLNTDLIDNEYKAFCKTLITNQFQDPETAETYLTVIGLSLYGELLVKKFFINKGYGDNGRSFFSNLIKAVLGDYHGTFSSNFFISKDSSDGSIICVESIKNKDKRFITINEPNSTNAFKSTNWAVEKIKTFTGNDIINVNAKHANVVTDKAIIMNMLNTWIKFLVVHSATKGRVVIIPQDTQFVDVCTLEHHKLKIKDDSFFQEDRFKNCTLFLFIEYWSKFVNNGLILILSKQIEDYTSELMDDKLDGFLEKYYIKTTSEKDFLVLDDIYNLYLQKVPQGNFPISSRSFKEKYGSKRLIVKKIDKGKGVNRINKVAILNMLVNNNAIALDQQNLIEDEFE